MFCLHDYRYDHTIHVTEHDAIMAPLVGERTDVFLICRKCGKTKMKKIGRGHLDEDTMAKIIDARGW